MTSFLRDLFLWWLDVMRQMILTPADGALAQSKRKLVCICAGGVNFASTGSPQQSETVALPDLENMLQLLGFNRKMTPGTITLRIEKGRAVVRKLSGTALPHSRHRAAALLDLQAFTPFRPEDVHMIILQARIGEATAGSNYAIVKRSILDPVTEALKQAGNKAARIEVDDGERIHAVCFADQRRLLGALGPSGSRILPFAIAAFALAAAGTLAHRTLQYDNAARVVETSVGQLSAEAKIVRAELDKRAMRLAEIQALRKSIEERKLVSPIWEELAKVLPDSSFLTDLGIKDSNVSITGYSAAASSIIVALEGSDLFEQASFTGPVVKVPGNSGDRFAIDLKMGGK
jgi:general secretion pathway protein L